MKTYSLTKKELDFILDILMIMQAEKKWHHSVYGSVLVRKLEKMRNED